MDQTGHLLGRQQHRHYTEQAQGAIASVALRRQAAVVLTAVPTSDAASPKTTSHQRTNSDLLLHRCSF